MSSEEKLDFGLKEWNQVCRALETGRQMMLLRKGGIYESVGEFEVEHRRFLLFPTFLHQNLKMLKPEWHVGFEPHSAEPEKITLRSWAEVTEIIELKDRKQMDVLDFEHIWTPPLIDMRFSYRPQNPLYLLIVRAFRLPQPVMVDNTPEYAGCKSWVPLERAVDVAGAVPVLGDDQFTQRQSRIKRQLSL